jgi:2,4-diaminopentanoate dehydrogenase
MKRNVKVAVWGAGAMGSGIVKTLLRKKGVDVIGVCDLHPDRVGKDVFELMNIKRGDRKPIIITSKIEDIISEKSCDVCLTATDSFTQKAFPRLRFLLENKINVVSTAEEMAYPKAKNPELAAELDKIAKENGVSVIGTGINPGLIMDLLVLTVSGAMTDLESVKVERVNSLSPFGVAVMEEQGVGLTKGDFIEKSENNELSGHVGFHESIEMIADAVGYKLEKPIVQTQAPIVTEVYRETPYAKVQAGDVAGCSMLGWGKVDGEVKIEMVHPQQIEPQLGGTNTGDYITLKGTPEINLAITPEVDGGIGTIAMCVNTIPHIINARPGLKTMIDIPVPRVIMGDMRNMIEVPLI